MQIKVPKGILKKAGVLIKKSIPQLKSVFSKHSNKILGGLAGLVAVDDLRLRSKRKKDEIEQEKKDHEVQAVLRKETARADHLEEVVNASEYIKKVNNVVETNEVLQKTVEQQSEIIQQKDEAIQQLGETIKKMKADDEDGNDETQER